MRYLSGTVDHHKTRESMGGNCYPPFPSPHTHIHTQTHTHKKENNSIIQVERNLLKYSQFKNYTEARTDENVTTWLTIHWSLESIS